MHIDSLELLPALNGRKCGESQGVDGDGNGTPRPWGETGEETPDGRSQH